MSLIEFKSPTGTNIFIESSKIMGIRALNENDTYVFVAAGTAADDWVVGEPVTEVERRVDAYTTPGTVLTP